MKDRGENRLDKMRSEWMTIERMLRRRYSQIEVRFSSHLCEHRATGILLSSTILWKNIRPPQYTQLNNFKHSTIVPRKMRVIGELMQCSMSS